MTDAKEAVIRVGDGRGFIVKDAGRIRLGWRGAKHIVITAAHCLPFLPPCRAYCELEERTYRALLGPLGQERVLVLVIRCRRAAPRTCSALVLPAR
jgi:hypothetical protein